MSKLEKIEGVGESFSQKLHEAGITTTDSLLEKGSSPQGRKDISEKSGIGEKVILKWVNQVDLARIKGINEEYGELLEVSGVDSVPELAHRKPENLMESLTRVNDSKRLVRKLPSLSQVSKWVDQAKSLPKIVTH
jgi:predicted flap endonuclease-1-like 5' DNA nuclease